MGCLCSTPAVEIATPSAVIAPSAHVKPSSNEDELTLPDSTLIWEPIVPLTERAVHPLFLSAVCQLEVVLPDRGSVKLADLYTYEVVFHFIKKHTEDTQISLVETLALMLLEDEETKAIMRPSSSSIPHSRPSSSSGRDSASSLTDISISIRHNFQARSPKEALRNILEKYVTWAGGAKPFHGPTNYFLSHAWSYKLGDLRDMCKQHYETVSGSEYKYFPIFYWIDIFAVAQNFTGDFQKHPDGNFPAVIRVSEGVVFTIHPWKNAIAPSRIWCLFEAVTAVEFGVNLELLVESEFRNTKMSKQQLLNSLQEAVSGLDVSKAKATVESDREMIIGMVKKREGGV
ncbi:hypothetical protein CEUSTIGMA_g6113.t1 [Chlamydomonas eustigma]|uniref:Uncharacterized protein n=1 Tax=Chlamydomonas eustigma TaxID=1157962 RepID=A0A250X6I4_9CHLO|nr:hypothetical protein CEUSTIGMA_g6113.t1 [Chlamydomonas eustigma]|eukprot:GAX78675.1 hypothetical protein CEUSTIGMA_g6113.t1 [Chlamydomonas eustigma]